MSVEDRLSVEHSYKGTRLATPRRKAQPSVPLVPMRLMRGRRNRVEEINEDSAIQI